MTSENQNLSSWKIMIWLKTSVALIQQDVNIDKNRTGLTEVDATHRKCFQPMKSSQSAFLRNTDAAVLEPDLSKW